MTIQVPDDLSALFPSEPACPPPATALAPIPDEGILAVAGADATRFLQGQLTCDVAALEAGSSTLGARCNPKGRMQSSFRLLKRSEQEYLLTMSADVLAAQQQDLAKYAAFFKVSLTEVTGHWLRLGLWGENPQPVLTAASADGAITLAAGDWSFEIWLPAGQTALANRLISLAVPAAPADWQLQLIRLGIGQVRAQTRESFIPQMLNLQQHGGVSFRKGCYTGQEIVARMQYLGKLKRRMFRLLWDGEQPPAPGTAIINRDNGQAVGEVVMAARAGNRVELLAVLQNEAAELSTLGISDAIEPSLQLATLPYDSQMAAEAADN